MQALVTLHPASERGSGANEDKIEAQARTNLHLAEQQPNDATGDEWLAGLACHIRRGEGIKRFEQPADAQNQEREPELHCSDIPRIINLRLQASPDDGSKVPLENGTRPRVRRLDDWQSLPSAVDEKRLRTSLHHHFIHGKPATAPRPSQTRTAQIPTLAEQFGLVSSSKSMSGKTVAGLPALTTGCTGMSSLARPLPSPPAFPNPQMESKLIQPLSLATCDYDKSPHPRSGVMTTSRDLSSRDHPVPSHSCSWIDWHCNGKPPSDSDRDLPRPTKPDNEPFLSRSMINRPCQDRSKPSFPDKLYTLLMNAELEQCDNIVSFLPSGQAFVIHKPQDFCQDVLPRWFGDPSRPQQQAQQAQSLVNWFLRELEAYGFAPHTTTTTTTTVTTIHSQGHDHDHHHHQGAFFHPSFRRGYPEGLWNMKRLPTRSSECQERPQPV